MERLIEQLKIKQGDRSISQFAMDLRIPPSTLSRIYNGSRNMGTNVLLRILDTYPDLTDYISPEKRRAVPIRELARK